MMIFNSLKILMLIFKECFNLFNLGDSEIDFKLLIDFVCGDGSSIFGVIIM